MENTDDVKPPDRDIVIRAIYTGKEPTLGKPKEPFCLGEIPILEAINKSQRKIFNELIALSQGRLFHNVELLSGRLAFDAQNEMAGFEAGTVLVLYDVPISAAEKFNEITDWKFERLSWSKYREIIEQEYKRVNRKRDALAEKLTSGWTRFFGFKLDSTVPQVVRVDVWLGKQERDAEFKSTDRYHYHVKLRARKTADLFVAIEYIEQGFYSLGVDVEIAVSVNIVEVYRTPEGLIDEPPK